MRIVVISHAYGGDGASQMLLLAARHWVRDLGWRVDAVVPRQLPAQALADIEACGMRAVKHALFGDGYDFAVVNCLHNIRFVEALRGRLPVALWAHEAQTILRSSGWDARRWQELFAGASKIIFQTRVQRDLYAPYLPPDAQTRVAIVPNAIPPIPAFGAAARQTAAHGDAMRIVALGKVTPLKGQADLVRAVAALSPRLQLRCELIGGDEHLDHLDAGARALLAERGDLFALRGALPRPLALQQVAAADLFCFPSHAESFGLAPLEAAALGTPVILADLDTYREVGWVHEQNCLLHAPGDAHGLASAIARLHGNPELGRTIRDGSAELIARYPVKVFLHSLTNAMLGLRLAAPRFNPAAPARRPP
jgi:glycosyltransferase involved in cell wall biosynthesis